MGGALCITHAVFHANPGDATPARFGFIVSKAVGGAVVRNRVRRRLKSIVDHRLSKGFNVADVVFRVLPAASTATFHELKHEVDHALDRLERRGRQHPAGTES